MATTTRDAGASTSSKPSLTELRNRRLGSVAEDAPMASPPAGGGGLGGSSSSSAPAANGTANGTAAEGEEAAPAPEEPYVPIKRSPPKATLTLEGLLFLLVGSCHLGSALLLAWFKPSAWVWAKWGFIGVGAGLVYSFLYHKNLRSKAEINQVVRRPGRRTRCCWCWPASRLRRGPGCWLARPRCSGPACGRASSRRAAGEPAAHPGAPAPAAPQLSSDVGAKGMQHLLEQLPSWINNSEKEKMEWLNSILLELWPSWVAAAMMARQRCCGLGVGGGPAGGGQAACCCAARLAARSAPHPLSTPPAPQVRQGHQPRRQGAGWRPAQQLQAAGHCAQDWLQGGHLWRRALQGGGCAEAGGAG
jgi:hypothetical protein